jgi:hypothetical protein
MPVTPEENTRYAAFVQEQVKTLGCLDFPSDKIIWHYTNGAGLLGIIETGSLRASHVACLNDSTEIRYASNLFRSAVGRLRDKPGHDAVATEFLARVAELANEEQEAPSHNPSRFFVVCFSAQEDDLSQWRAYGDVGGENGYAIGFHARGFFSQAANRLVVKVNYDAALHAAIADEVAEATLRFYREGLEARQNVDPPQWAEEFFQAWDEWIYRLAPMVKDECFKTEQEFRIVNELHVSELGRVRFIQKETLLSRYLPLYFPGWMPFTRVPMLPIARVMVGPGRQQAITQTSVNLLLQQMGYGTDLVTASKRPLQRP